jgi:Protein of unknown function (DUF2892)
VKQNMGSLDRILRTVIVAPVLIVLGLVVFEVGSLPSIIAFVLAGVMLATSAVGFCPLYLVLGISTCPRRARGAVETRVPAR